MSFDPLANLAKIGLLDALRKQRNLSDYEGDAVTQALLDECLSQAQTVLALALEQFDPVK